MFAIDGAALESDMELEWVAYRKDSYASNKINVFWMDIWEEKEAPIVREWSFALQD